MGNIFPGKLANNDTVATTCLRSTSGNVSGPDNVLSPLSKHCVGYDRTDSTPRKINPPEAFAPMDLPGTWNLVNESKGAQCGISAIFG